MRTAKSNTATLTIFVRQAIKKGEHVSPAALGEAAFLQRAMSTA